MQLESCSRIHLEQILSHVQCPNLKSKHKQSFTWPFCLPYFIFSGPYNGVEEIMKSNSLWLLSFMRPYKTKQWSLHIYNMTNFVTSWLKWLQMILNEFKWLLLIHKTHRDPFKVISDLLKSFKKSWGDKINM